MDCLRAESHSKLYVPSRHVKQVYEASADVQAPNMTDSILIALRSRSDRSCLMLD